MPFSSAYILRANINFIYCLFCLLFVSVSYTHLSDTEEIGTDRVEALVSASPSDEDGETRETVVKTEIEDNDNDNLTIPQVVNRLGMVFFLLIFNLGITIFIFLLTVMMLFSQILFIIYAMFLPVSFLLSMIQMCIRDRCIS